MSEFDVSDLWTGGMNFVGGSSWCLLAQDAAPTPFELPFPVLIAIMIALFYFIMLRPQQSKDKEFKEMLAGLKEKDRVVTIGGIHGVVTNVQRDREEVTIRVDESSGTKLHVNKSAIAKLVTDDDQKEKKTN